MEQVHFIAMSLHLPDIDIVVQNKRVSDLEREALHKCRQRAEHLWDVSKCSSTSTAEWTRAWLPRLLVDYLLRQGLFDSARAMSDHYACEDLCEWGIFRNAQAIVQDLRQRSCKAALAWCEPTLPACINVLSL